MASDKQQIERMEGHRATLLNEKRFSSPSGSGRTAIFMMYGPDPEADEGVLLEDGPDAMDGEARRIQRYLRWRGTQTVYFQDASIEDFWEALDDPLVSDMVVIGCGCLTSVRMQAWTRKQGTEQKAWTANFYDAISRDGRWPTISHLKLGSFYQRTCGLMNGSSNVPFPWGFMADRNKIWASPQVALCPNPWQVRPRAGLSNLIAGLQLDQNTVQGLMTYDQVKACFGPREPLTSRRYAVPKFAYSTYDRLKHYEIISQANGRIVGGLRSILDSRW